MVNGGVGQAYENGSIYYSPASGAHLSMGAIRNLWASTGSRRASSVTRSPMSTFQPAPSCRTTREVASAGSVPVARSASDPATHVALEKSTRHLIKKT